MIDLTDEAKLERTIYSRAIEGYEVMMMAGKVEEKDNKGMIMMGMYLRKKFNVYWIETSPSINIIYIYCHNSETVYLSLSLMDNFVAFLILGLLVSIYVLEDTSAFTMCLYVGEFIIEKFF